MKPGNPKMKPSKACLSCGLKVLTVWHELPFPPLSASVPSAFRGQEGSMEGLRELGLDFNAWRPALVSQPEPSMSLWKGQVAASRNVVSGLSQREASEGQRGTAGQLCWPHLSMLSLPCHGLHHAWPPISLISLYLGVTRSRTVGTAGICGLLGSEL